MTCLYICVKSADNNVDASKFLPVILITHQKTNLIILSSLELQIFKMKFAFA